MRSYCIFLSEIPWVIQVRVVMRSYCIPFREEDSLSIRRLVEYIYDLCWPDGPKNEIKLDTSAHVQQVILEVEWPDFVQQKKVYQIYSQNNRKSCRFSDFFHQFYTNSTRSLALNLVTFFQAELGENSSLLCNEAMLQILKCLIKLEEDMFSIAGHIFRWNNSGDFLYN